MLGSNKNKVLLLSATLVLLHMAIEYFRVQVAPSFLLRVSCSLTFIYGPISYYVVMDWDGKAITLRRTLPHLLPMAIAFVIYDPANYWLGLTLKVGLSLCLAGYAYAGLRKIHQAKLGKAIGSIPAMLPFMYWMIALVGLINLLVVLLPVRRALEWPLGFVTVDATWFSVVLPNSGMLIMFSIAFTSILFIALALHQPRAFQDGVVQEVVEPTSYRDQLDEEDRRYLSDLTGAIQARLREDELYCDANLTIGRLARKLGVPERDVSRSINLIFDQTFPELITDMRIKKAQELLRSEDQAQISVVEIQLQCGFNTKSNFYRAFKQALGVTPSQYRSQATNPMQARAAQ